MIRLDPLSADHFPRLADLGTPSEVGLPMSNIHLIMEQAAAGSWLVRTIIEEASGEPIGLITVGGFTDDYVVGHMGTWLGIPYWGKGINRLAKDAMLAFAFANLPLEEIFLSPRVTNPRAIQALKKIPYVEHDVGMSFRTLHAGIEKVRGPVVLCRVGREGFEAWRRQVTGALERPRSSGLSGEARQGEAPLTAPIATRGGTGPLPSLPPGALAGQLDVSMPEAPEQD